MSDDEADLCKLAKSEALWNRHTLNLTSREVLAQIIDGGSTDDWRALYRLAERAPELRGRIRDVVETIPLDAGPFWLAALASLGEPVDLAMPLPRARE